MTERISRGSSRSGSAPLILGVILALGPAGPLEAQNQPDNLGRAVTAPLRDARIQEDKIPPILQKAVDAPYSLEGLRNCAAIGAEVDKLTQALGADVDVPAASRSQASEIAIGAAGAAASAAAGAAVPGLGLLKVVTGADKQQKRVQAAVFAGSVRRGFLKGVGLSRKCAAPAAPRTDPGR